MRAAHDAGAHSAVASYAGRPRNPVLLARSTWPGVADAARGDEGARGWLAQHPELVVHVDCTDVGSPDDLDTPQDLARLRPGAGSPAAVGDDPAGRSDDRSAPARPAAHREGAR